MNAASSAAAKPETRRRRRGTAFPCISTGVYGYPFGEAARIAVDTVRAVLEASPGDMGVTFCCFSEGDLAVYGELLSQP